MAERPLTKTDYEMLSEFRYSLRQFLHFSEEAAKKAGVTPQQHQTLLAIKGFPGRENATVGEIAERLQLRHHSAVGLIDRLVEEKLVLRLPSDRDRRKVLVRLAPRGEKVLEKLSFAHRRQINHLGPQFKVLLGRLASLNG